ncbi:hypothetical protein LCGC14_2178570 [marine sediment metagenome]|uniref:Uncharacterized protein n=1 Tax=marine sediment metagenome TaxID=412755 RepID=A0A0F9DMZ6_9ZZZZ
MTVPNKIPDIERPYRVSHTNGDIIKGLMTIEAAEADAKERNQRALDIGFRARYIASAKP